MAKSEHPTKFELTDGFLKTISVLRRTDFSDTRVEGLQIRVSPAGGKTFALRARNPSGLVLRVTLGKYPALRLKDAREMALRMVVDVRQGRDFNAEKRAAREEKPGIPTLQDLLEEYGAIARSMGKGIWQYSPTGKAPQAFRTIHCVFGSLTQRPVCEVTEAELAAAMGSYRRIGRTGSNVTANGQASKARLYLMPVLDWAAGRNRFRLLGSGRTPPVATPDLRLVFDPAKVDPTITGVRERVLDGEEIRKILPWLTYPAPGGLGLRLAPESDYRPIALRFILLTAPRRGEVEQMKWKDVDFNAGTWTKPRVKTTRGKSPRRQVVHLSDVALDLLREFPPKCRKHPNAHVFPNEKGGHLDNWPRITRAIQEASGTKDWNRHDLRRTASTLLDLLGTDANLIARVLGHRSTKKDNPARTALQHYIMEARLIAQIEDPMKIALDQLGRLILSLERDNHAEMVPATIEA